MEFPEREVALTWVGRTLVDRDGTEIGACTAVFTDDATRVTEWVCSDVGGAAVFIPAAGATESGERVQVAVSREDVANAPAVGGTKHISAEDEAALYRHYATPHPGETAPDLRSVAEGGDGPTASGRRRVLPVAAGLAGVGTAVGAVLGLRRLRRRRPPTRTERILARGRAVSSAVSAGTGRVVRRPGRASAVAALPAAALTVRALRRRRSGTDPDAD